MYAQAPLFVGSIIVHHVNADITEDDLKMSDSHGWGWRSLVGDKKVDDSQNQDLAVGAGAVAENAPDGESAKRAQSKTNPGAQAANS